MPVRVSSGLKLICFFIVFLLGMFMVAASDAKATPPSPTYGTAVVDGSISEWNLTTDLFGSMYRAFNNTKPLEAQYYLRYNCTTEVLYVLVQTEDGVDALEEPTNAWATVDGGHGKVYTGADEGNTSVPEFEWVGPFGTNATLSETTATGYEAAFSLAPGSHTVVIHVEVFDDGGAQTAGSAGSGDSLEISCTGGSTGSISIIKDTVPNDAQDFSFSTTGGLSPSSFSLDDDSDGTLSNTETFSSLANGSYSVTEASATGFTLDDITCSGNTSSTFTFSPSALSSFQAGDTSVSITLASAEDLTCTFRNIPTSTPTTGSISIIKDTVPNDAQDFSYSTTGGLSPSSFSLDDDSDGTLSNTETFSSLADGSYSVTEASAAGFTLDDITCSGNTSSTFTFSPSGLSSFQAGDTSVSITLASAEDLTCTFRNIPTSTPSGSLDFGDAPDGLGGPSYPTLLASNGARHTLGSGLLMGTTVDSESDGQPNLAATGDGSDEDGVYLPALFVEGGTPTFTVGVVNPTASMATLTCWMDMNGDGTFDSSERGTATVPAGTNETVTITLASSIPAGAAATLGGITYLRCRLSTDGVLAPDGLASDGEVEDYKASVSATDKDSDDDGIPDSVEGPQDRDHDGIPDYLDRDPQGYIYCENNGKIMPGGSISVSGPAPATIVLDGSTGIYSFMVSVDGMYVLTVTPPPGTTIDNTFLNSSIFDPTGMPDPVVLGPGENGGTGFLTPGYPTTFYINFDLMTGDPLIIDNNIPLICPAAAVGGDPPVWGNVIVFPTPEAAHGQDLNNDGDLDDTVLRYEYATTGEIVNTGISVSGRHRDTDIYGENIVFVQRPNTLLDKILSMFNPSGQIGVYNITTGKTRMLGISGSKPAIYGNIISISGSQLSYYDLSRSKLIKTDIPAENQVIWGKMIAYETVPESSDQPQIYLYNVESAATITTGAAGSQPAIQGNVVTFQTREQDVGHDLNGDGDALDTVIRYYDIATGKTFNTQMAGQDPAVYGNHIVFSQDHTILYYDIEKHETLTTGDLGTEPDIYGSTITYYVWEEWRHRDLNLDGDERDPIIGTHSISDSDRVLVQTHATQLVSQRVALGQLRVQKNSFIFAIKAQGANIESTRLEVYGMNGQLLFDSGFTAGNESTWRWLRADGARVANGVYLYRIIVRGEDGQRISSPVKMVLVLR
ncbi:thrombospondin type 3 repeat-containing protein [Candidatus Acetothermia bacterium]|nr:thrombospondin type 3 repeat-containing protein [Candidatus Acetothermia bacterium]MBI3642652.1 thrombospondin type 3 repeat-containing protein [Candidatus Acetothermia bacterium]